MLLLMLMPQVFSLEYCVPEVAEAAVPCHTLLTTALMTN
jgi:hypothetical protein